jgi:signal transduction histidine kinase
MGTVGVDSRESSQNKNQPARQKSRWSWKPLRLQLYGLQGKLILPYVLLTLFLAAIGTYVVTRLVTGSLRERFVNQVYEASRFASDSIVRLERRQLEDLRLAAFSEGVPQAFGNGDSQQIEEIFKPLVATRHIQILTAVDLSGRELVTIGQDPYANEYYSSHGADLSSEPLALYVLKGVTDESGDKFAGLVKFSQGWALVTSTSVIDEQGALKGALLVGTYLDQVLLEIKTSVLADVILFDQNNQMIAATFPEPEEGYLPLKEAAALKPESGKTQTNDVTLNHRTYAVAYNDLVVRRSGIGRLGVVLPTSFVVATEATSRNLFSLLFTGGTIAIILIGFYLAQNIARPILKLRSITQAVAAGDLTQSSDLKRSDEIGELADAFDAMTLHLRERTQEATRLYAETLQRNKELAEINARLKAAQIQLVQSEKLAAIGQLTAGIVHDVKNPFAVIMGMAEVLGDEDDLSETMRNGLKMMRESAVKGNTIVSDLLKFARQSESEMKLRDLRETMQTAVRLTAYLTRRFKQEIILPESPLYATYDAQQLEQVLINLIHNAIQAMQNGGSLKLSLKQVDDTAQIGVQDTGSGIDPKHLKRIFDPFFTTKPEGEGTGLGLSVSYGIIANHNGRIEVTSELGKGTEFTVILPLMQASDAVGDH